MFLVGLCSSGPVYWLGSFHSLAPHEIHERINTHKHRISDVNSKKVMHWYYIYIILYIILLTVCLWGLIEDIQVLKSFLPRFPFPSRIRKTQSSASVQPRLVFDSSAQLKHSGFRHANKMAETHCNARSLAVWMCFNLFHQQTSKHLCEATRLAWDMCSLKEAPAALAESLTWRLQCIVVI